MLSSEAQLSQLEASLEATPPLPPAAVAEILDQIRRLLPVSPSSFKPQSLSKSAVRVLRSHPGNLLLCHRAVAVLAHPALCGGQPGVEAAVVSAMDRLAMSAAFQHTAMAALQNAAGGRTDRDVVVLAVVAAMRQHHSQSGVLLRGADLIAFHLSQMPGALTSSYRVAAGIIVDTIDNLSNTPQGASTSLLALIATLRHFSSLVSFGGRPSSTTRFSRSSIASSIVDHQFAYAVVLSMARHRSHSAVQVLACKVIRVGTAGVTSSARIAARELYAAGAASAVVTALQTHSGDVSLIDRALVALRSLLLGGGFHGRAVKPGLNVDEDFAEVVIRVANRVSNTMAMRDRDLSSAAAVLAVDVRNAVLGTRRERMGEGNRISAFGKRIIRRIRFGNKLNFYETDHPRYSEEDDMRAGKEYMRARRGSGRASFSRVHSMHRNGMASMGFNEGGVLGELPSSHDDLGMEDREAEQITLNRRWRSVSGRWNQRGRKGSAMNSMDITRASTAIPSHSGGKRERRGPLALSSSGMANLTRQSSKLFSGDSDVSGKRESRNGKEQTAMKERTMSKDRKPGVERNIAMDRRKVSTGPDGLAL